MHCIYCVMLCDTLTCSPLAVFAHTHTHIYMGEPLATWSYFTPPLHTSAPLPLAKGEDGF